MDPQAAKLIGADHAAHRDAGANEFSGLGIHGLSPVSLGLVGLEGDWSGP